MRTFHKYSGAGNTFLIVDDREETLSHDRVPLLSRSTGDTPVDGVILWRLSCYGDAEMVYFNRDGSRGEMCGNGLRCFVHFLHEQGLESVNQIEVSDKLLQVKRTPPTIWTYLQEAHVLFWGLSLCGYILYVVDTGVPHAVIFAQDSVDVVKEGMKIRQHSRFSPQGVNVNFVWMKSQDEIAVRTYERGVEAETLACGTGAVACAYVAERLGYTEKQVRVVTRSGSALEVDLKEGNKVGGPCEKLGVWQLSC